MLTQSQKDWNVKLIEALRSGKYGQVQGRLHRNTPEETGYCCLGVACELSGLGSYEPFPALCEDCPPALVFALPGSNPRESSGLYPPREVRELFGFATQAGHTIGPEWENMATLNDNGRTFAEIADMLEKWLEKQEIEKEAQCP